MKASLYTVAYAAVLGGICAGLLTGAGRFTAPYREANARAEEFRHILRVLEVPHEESASPEELLETFEKNVRVVQRGVKQRGEKLYVYTGGESGDAQAVAVPIAGPGLWGPIRGFLALEPGMDTIRGVTFHEQEETPGLGGEIASDWFLRQFKGKSILDSEGKPGIRIRRGGGASAANEVDAITGATMTCEKVEAILNSGVRRALVSLTRE